MTSLLSAQALSAPDHTQTAIIYVQTDHKPITVTRADFRASVHAYASGLQALGVSAHDLVLIAHTQNLESIYAFWGAMLIGAVPSMFPTLTEKLAPDIYMRNMSELVDRSGVRMVLTTDDFAPTLAERVACPVIGSDKLQAHVNDNAKDGVRRDEPMRSSADVYTHTPDPDDIAFLQHTSGTTGLQKGIMLSHRAVLNQLEHYAQALQWRDDDVIVSWLPLYHDMGLIAGFMLPLVKGVPLILMSPFDWVSHPALLLRAINDYGGTLCWLPNFAYNHMARRIRPTDSAGLDLSSMRMFINCSEPVYAHSHDLFAERFAENGVTPEMLQVSYAMAENTFAVTQTTPDQTPNRDVIDVGLLEDELRAVNVADDHERAVVKVSCGKPINGTFVRVVDDSGADLPERHVGELQVQSDCMLSGYYQRDDLHPIVEGWYQTGDRGYIADGEVYVIGRSKDLIINAGKNVYPQDIEALANSVAGVKKGRVVAFGVPDEKEGTELIALIAETELSDKAERKALSKAIRKAVGQGSTVTLSYVQIVDPKWLIKTSSGKIARNANRDKWMTERGK